MRFLKILRVNFWEWVKKFDHQDFQILELGSPGTSWFCQLVQALLSVSQEYSVDSLVNMSLKIHKVLTLDKRIEEIKLIESVKSSRKVAEEFSVGPT